jgi:hypothetical protein
MTSAPPPPVPAPTISPAERVRFAYADRANTDYVFEGKGMVIFLMIVTCGIYGYFVFYQLMRRMRDHNRRRLELLEGATELAWQQASERGIAEEMRPNFERISQHLAVLRSMTLDFRDPALWIVIAIFSSGVGLLVGFVFLDQDLVKHDQNEGPIEADLSYIYGRLGQNVPAPDAARLKGQHNYAGRIIASFASCSIYSYWWYYDLMEEGNIHFAHNWPWEDALAGAVYQLTEAA